jgi:hypothetical protein
MRARQGIGYKCIYIGRSGRSQISTVLPIRQLAQPPRPLYDKVASSGIIQTSEPLIDPASVRNDRPTDK